MSKLEQPLKPMKQFVEQREVVDFPNGETLDTWIKVIQSWIDVERYGKAARFEVMIDYGYNEEYRLCGEIISQRLETDHELNERLQEEARQAEWSARHAELIKTKREKKLEADRKLYLRLKKQFETE